jgi:glycosyltransferase involved in cell wall biosynthesis
MNIIITVNSYEPLKDGVQSVTKYHAEGLIKRGHKVTVITRKIDNEPITETINGVDVIRVDAITKHAIHYGDRDSYHKLIFELTKKTDILINVCTQTALTDWTYLILDKIQCKKVLYMHGMVEFKWNKNNFNSIFSIASKLWNNLRWKIYYKQSIKYFKQYDGVVQLHTFDDAYKLFEKNNIRKCEIIENAAENGFFCSNKHENIKKPEKYIICVANYVELKNQMMCLEAFYESKELGYSMIFIGSEETNYYKSLLAKNDQLKKFNKERDVKFLIGISRTDIYEYVKHANIYIFGSKVEKYPVSIIESMASGVPFISTDVGCVKFLPGGVIVKNKNEMTYWLNKLMEDEKLSKSIGNSGKVYAEKNLNIDSKIEQFEIYLKRLV